MAPRHPGQNWPHLIYWGHYVAHDNNRDAMGMTLELTRNVLNTYVGWNAQVLHDLHESVPYPLRQHGGRRPLQCLDRSHSWPANGQMMGWNNVSQMTKFGMPGVFTHGTFDTWRPGYLMFIAAMHNGISRLYETFGNGGADTEKRTLEPERICAHLVSARTRRCPRRNGRSATTITTKRPALLTALSYFCAECAAAVPPQFLSEEQALHPKARHRGSGRLRFGCR